MDRGAISDFLNKAYAIVDDPSTDSVISWSQDGKSFIVWHPAECCRDLFPRILGITNPLVLGIYGFKVNANGGRLMEVACDDFVRGRPELLDKISERHMEKVKKRKADYESLRDRLKKCKTQEEKDLVFKENMENAEKRRRERMDKAYASKLDDLMKRIAIERETREKDGSLPKDLEDSVQRILI